MSSVACPLNTFEESSILVSLYCHESRPQGKGLPCHSDKPAGVLLCSHKSKIIILILSPSSSKQAGYVAFFHTVTGRFEKRKALAIARVLLLLQMLLSAGAGRIASSSSSSAPRVLLQSSRLGCACEERAVVVLPQNKGKNR